MTLSLDAALADVPVIAILRGLTPSDAEAIGEVLVEAGVRVLEVPLNSPEPLESIRILSKLLAGRAVVGAGTVLDTRSVDAIAAAGARFAVAPNTVVDVIERCRAVGLEPIPGVGTATEAFAAITAGASRLKLFPASTYGPGHLKALRDVLPVDVEVFAVGGVGAGNLADWHGAGAAGVGAGGSLYRAGVPAPEVGECAAGFIEQARLTWQALPPDTP